MARTSSAGSTARTISASAVPGPSSSILRDVGPLATDDEQEVGIDDRDGAAEPGDKRIDALAWQTPDKP